MMFIPKFIQEQLDFEGTMTHLFYQHMHNIFAISFGKI